MGKEYCLILYFTKIRNHLKAIIRCSHWFIDIIKKLYKKVIDLIKTTFKSHNSTIFLYHLSINFM